MTGELHGRVPERVITLIHAITSRMPRDVDQVLRLQVDAAWVTAETPGRSVDFTVPPDAPRVPLPNGPAVPIPAVVDEAGQMSGEVLLWVQDGHVIGVERAWVTDDAPLTWPGVEELDFGRVDARVEARIPAASRAGRAQRPSIALGVVSIVSGIPITAIVLSLSHASVGGMVLLVVVWMAIVAVNLAYTRQR